MQTHPRVKLEPPSCETATSRCGTSPSSPTSGRASKVAKLDLEKSRDEDQDWEGGSTWASSLQEIDQHVSFVPVEGSTDPEPESPRHLIPNRRIAVADILPLSLSSGQVGRTINSFNLVVQVSLAVDPTSSSLPISPIFIKTGGGGGGVQGVDEGGEEGNLVTYGLLDNFEELPNIPTELLSLGNNQ